MKQFYIPLILLIAVGQITCEKSNKEEGTVDFTYVKGCIGGTPCTVQFKNRSTGNATFKWDFGDNSPFSNEQNPQHTFMNGVSFTVTLFAQYANSTKSSKQVINLSALGPCETKGSFTCAKKLFSRVSVQDTMNSTKYNYYYFNVDTPGVVYIELNAVPGKTSDTRFTISLMSAAIDNWSNVLREESGKGGEVISFHGGPLNKKEYYLRVRDNYGNAGAEPFKLLYRFVNTDLNEPNETFSTATSLDLGLHGTKKATLLAKNDKDTYKYHQDKAGVVDILVTPVPDLGKNESMTAEIYKDANSNSLIRRVYNYSGETMRFSIGPLDTGYHYITLYNSYTESTDQYNITATYDPWDAQEMNNNFNQATRVSLNSPIKGQIKSIGDEDYFQFTALSNAPLTISIPSVPAGLGYLYAEVYSDLNSNSGMGYGYGRDHAPIQYTTTQSLQAGKIYYIRLYANSRSVESNEVYTMTIKQ